MRRPARFSIALTLSCLFLPFSLAAEETSYPVILPPEQVKKLQTAPTLQSAVTTYAYIGFAAYGDAHLSVAALRDAAYTFKKEPSAANLEVVRATWLAARKPYLVTEAFRFYDGPIDVFATDIEVPSPEVRINAWPIRPGYLEATKAKPKDGLTGRMKNIDAETLRNNHMEDDDRNVTMGFHVIEYMLWGEAKNGKPTRTISDFTDGSDQAKRRMQLLTAATELLPQETNYLRAMWYPLDKLSFASRMIEKPEEAMGKILTGLATLSMYELPEKHLGLVPNDDDRTVLQSPYSRTSYDDLLQTVTGMRQIMEGDYGPIKAPGLFALLESKDKTFAEKLKKQNQATIDAAKAMPQPMDGALPAKPGSSAHNAATRLSDELKAQGKLLLQAATILGVKAELTGD